LDTVMLSLRSILSRSRSSGKKVLLAKAAVIRCFLRQHDNDF
jgi:hypothetical protein